MTNFPSSRRLEYKNNQSMQRKVRNNSNQSKNKGRRTVRGIWSSKAELHSSLSRANKVVSRINLGANRDRTFYLILMTFHWSKRYKKKSVGKCKAWWILTDWTRVHNQNSDINHNHTSPQKLTSCPFLPPSCSLLRSWLALVQQHVLVLAFNRDLTKDVNTKGKIHNFFKT